MEVTPINACYDSGLAAVKATLACRAVRRATRRLGRVTGGVRGLACSSACSGRGKAHRPQSQARAFPSKWATPPLVPPEAATPDQHARFAAVADHPAVSCDPSLPDDVREAAQSLMLAHAEGRSAAPQRNAVMRVLKQVKRDLRATNDRIEAHAAPHVKGMVQRVDVALLHVLAEVVGSPDSDLAAGFAVGLPAVGDIPPSGWWPVDCQQAEVNLDSMPHAQWNAQVEAEARRSASQPHRAGEVAAVWERTLQEVREGLMAGPFDRWQLDAAYGPGTYRAMIRFGVLQNAKIRACDNARASLHNDGTTTFEKLVCEGADFPARACLLFAQLARDLGVDMPTMAGGTDDLADAYRHVPTNAPNMTVVVLPDPSTGEPKYFTLPGFNFGLRAAVPQFNRFPELMTAVARRMLDVVCSHYFDDYVVVEPLRSARHAQHCLATLHRLVGFPFAAAKHVKATGVFVFLGVQSDLTRAHLGAVTLAVTKRRVDSILTRIEETLADGRLPHAAAASLCGKLQFTLSWAFGRLGRACMQPLFNHAGGDLSPGLIAALSFLRQVLPTLPPHHVDLTASRDLPTLVWSDGASEGDGEINTIGFLVATPRPGAQRPQGRAATAAELEANYTFRHGAAPVAPALMRVLLRRRQQIGQVELVGAVAPYLSLPAELAGRRVIHFIDNTSALAALAKGYSGVPDSAHIVHVFHAWAAAASTSVWFEYVPSAANPADEPSRVLGLAERAWRLPAGPMSHPVPCAQPPLQRLADAEGWAREAARVRASQLS